MSTTRTRHGSPGSHGKLLDILRELCIIRSMETTFTPTHTIESGMTLIVVVQVAAESGLTLVREADGNEFLTPDTPVRIG